MIEELHLSGVYMPAALVWAVLAGLLTYSLRNLLQHIRISQFLWHPGILELAVFATLWWLLTFLGDHLSLRTLVS